MPVTRILALGIALMLANILNIVTTHSWSAETLWCRMVMGRCFLTNKGDWVEVPIKPNSAPDSVLRLLPAPGLGGDTDETKFSFSHHRDYSGRRQTRKTGNRRHYEGRY
jgi:hypothetical protein